MLKKKYRAVALVLAMSTIMSGCSVSQIPSVKEMMVGVDKYELDYDPVETIEKIDYKGVEVDCTVSDEEIQTEIDNLLESNKLQVKKGTCKKGDTVNIDYSGKKDGKEFDGGTAENQMITLGESSMIDGFDDAIIGMKVGEKKNAKMKFPKDYHEKSLAGQDVVFTIKLNYISKDATFDDAFVAEHTDYKTVDAYKEGTRKSMSETKKSQAGASVFEKLMGEAKVTNAPQSLHDKWEKIIRNDLEYQAKSYGVDVETLLAYSGLPEKETYVKNTVENQVKQVLLIEMIVEQEELEITEDDIKAEIEKACQEAGMSESDYRADFDEYYQGEQTLEEYMWFSLKAQKVLEILKDNAKIKE